MAASCPACGGVRFGVGVGTEQVEAAVRDASPRRAGGPARPRRGERRRRRGRRPRPLRAPRAGRAGGHADGDQGARLPRRDAGRRGARRHRAGAARLPRRGADLPAAHPGGRARRARRRRRPGARSRPTTPARPAMACAVRPRLRRLRRGASWRAAGRSATRPSAGCWRSASRDRRSGARRCAEALARGGPPGAGARGVHARPGPGGHRADPREEPLAPPLPGAGARRPAPGPPRPGAGRPAPARRRARSASTWTPTPCCRAGVVRPPPSEQRIGDPRIRRDLLGDEAGAELAALVDLDGAREPVAAAPGSRSRGAGRRRGSRRRSRRRAPAGRSACPPMPAASSPAASRPGRRRPCRRSGRGRRRRGGRPGGPAPRRRPGRARRRPGRSPRTAHTLRRSACACAERSSPFAPVTLPCLTTTAGRSASERSGGVSSSRQRPGILMETIAAADSSKPMSGMPVAWEAALPASPPMKNVPRTSRLPSARFSRLWASRFRIPVTGRRYPRAGTAASRAASAAAIRPRRVNGTPRAGRRAAAP